MPDEKPPEGGQQHESGGTPQTFEAWLTAQADDVKALVAEGTRGLKSALDAERAQRREFEKQLRDVTAKADAGSEARKQLEELAGRLEAESKRADFFEAAHATGITNVKLAWLVVQADGLMDKQNRVNWDALAKAYPELVRKPGPPAGNAGSGTGAEPPKGKGMNEFIRRAAGRGG